MRPKNLIDKKPRNVLEIIERQCGDCTNFMDKYNYETGFNNLNFEDSIELLSILAVKEEASNRIEENISSIINGYTDAYEEQTLLGFEKIYRYFQSNFKEVNLRIDYIIYDRLNEKDNIDELEDFCRKLIKNVGPETSSIANYLTLFVACREILNNNSGSDIQTIISNQYLDNIYNVGLSYYSLDREKVENMDKDKSEFKALSYRKMLIEESSNIESDFFNLCYYRSESIIERERHCKLNNPRELHILIAETMIKCCKKNIKYIESKEKELKQKYSKLYSYQCNAIRMRINSNHRESARKYFLASNVAGTFRSNRRAKLETQGYREVAKNYADYEKRITIYNNAIEYFKNSDHNTDVVEDMVHNIELELEISKSQKLFDKYRELENKLRKKVSDAKRLEDGSEKFMNEDVEVLSEILDYIDNNS